MNPRNEGSDVDSELEELRRKLEQQQSQTEYSVSQQFKTEAKTTIKNKNSSPPNAVITVLAVAVLGAGASFTAWLKTQEQAPATTKTIVTEVNQTNQKPGVGSPAQNLQTGENLKAAEKLAMEAAVLVQKPPHPAQVWLQAQQKWQQAIALLEAIPASDVQFAAAQKKLATYRSNYAAISKRVELAQKAVNFNNRGVEKIQQQDYQRAVEYFTQAVSLNPLVESYLGRGIAYSEMGDHQKAIQEYSQVIKLNANHADAFLYRGLSHYMLEDDNQASEDIDRAIKINPQYAAAYLERGALRYQLGLEGLGIADLRKAAELFSQQGDTNNQNLALELIEEYRENADETLTDEEPKPEPDKCEKLWQSHSPGLPCYLPEIDIDIDVNRKKREQSGTSNITSEIDRDKTSVRSPSSNRGKSSRRGSGKR